MKQVRVLLADDHTIVRKGLRVLLEDSGFMDVIAEAEHGREVLDLVDQHRPDVVVMDISMPLLNGLEATRRIKARYPDIRVVMLTMHQDEEYVLQSLYAGAEAYIVKQSAPKDLVKAIEQALDDQIFVTTQHGDVDVKELIARSRSALEHDPYSSLTRREREVLQLIAEGNDIGQIATLLRINQKTVRAHRSHLMDKLGLHNPAALTRYALQKGIITIDPRE